MFQKHCVWEVWSVESFNRGMFANVDWEYLENTDGVEGNKLLGWGNQVIEVTYDVYICSYIYIYTTLGTAETCRIQVAVADIIVGKLSLLVY